MFYDVNSLLYLIYYRKKSCHFVIITSLNDDGWFGNKMSQNLNGY